MRRARSLFVLGGIALLVGGLWWWDQHQPAADDHQLVPGFDRAALTSLTITRDGTVTTLSRAGGVWTVGGIRADAEAVDQLVGALEFGSIERTVGKADAALAQQHGLRPPRLIVDTGGHPLVLGHDAPGGRGVYAERDGRLLVVDSHLKDVADLPPDKWRLGRLLLTDTGAIKTLEHGDWKLARDGDRFTVNGAPADPRAVDQLLDTLDRARAVRISTQRLDAGEPITVNGAVEVRRGKDGFTRADGALLSFGEHALDPLFQTALELREPRLYPAALNEVTGVELVEGDQRLSLQREGGVWRIVAPLEHAGPADDPSVRAWLAGEVLPLRSTQERGPQRLTVRTAGASFTHAVAGLSFDPLRFRDRRVIDLRPEEIDQLIVEQRGASETITRAQRPELIETFAQLRAESFFRPATPPTPSRTLRAKGHEVALSGCDARIDGKLWTHLDPRTCRTLTE